MARTWGSHHLPPYSIFCNSPRGPHPNGFLSWDSQVRVPKFPQLGPLQFWRRITSRVDLRLQWGLNQSCSPCWQIFNGMSHAACMQGNWVDSWLLVVGSQIGNLTPDLSFDHNLCFKCPNGKWKPILDIYASIAFQWYKELFEEMGFDPCNCVLKIWESIWDSNSYNGSSLGSVRIHALTFFALSGACDLTPQVFLLACNLATPCFGREPKAKVATYTCLLSKGNNKFL
jgi:hypothetical protein